jgi:hypothetical protein
MAAMVDAGDTDAIRGIRVVVFDGIRRGEAFARLDRCNVDP